MAYMKQTLAQKIKKKNKSKSKGNSITLKPIQHKRSIEKRYYKAISKYVKSIVRHTEKTLFDIQKSYNIKDNSISLIDFLGTDIINAIDGLRHYYNMAGDIQRIVANFMTEVDADIKGKFYKQINDIFGINLNEVIADENLAETLALANKQNVSLIKTIPERYFNAIENMVMASFTSGEPDIVGKIKKLGYSTDFQARRIARDQSSKISASMTRLRSQNLGSKKYEWYTSLDERVRDTHRVNHGKIFEWDKPPAVTGHPSHDINCRCVALSIIDIDSL